MTTKSFPERLYGHFITITRHKFKVMGMCFRCGLIKQGLLHDLSKYAPSEFNSGVKYYQGYRSPIAREREIYGYSNAWLHHAGRNKHHWEYWMDKDYHNIKLITMEMPFNYQIESMIDRIAASKVYKGKEYNDAAPYEFFINGKDKLFMHPENVRQTDFLLSYLKEYGERKALRYYKELYHKWKKDHSFKI